MGQQGSKESAHGKDDLANPDDRAELEEEEEALSRSRDIRLLMGHEDIVRCVIKVDDHRIASASDDSTVIIWCSRSGERLFRLSGHTRPVTCMIFMDPNFLITGSSDKSIRVWDTVTGRCLHILQAHDGSVTCLHAMDQSKFISGGNDRKLYMWKTDGKRLGHIERQEEENLYCLLPIRNDKVVTGSNSSLLLVYKTDTRTHDRLLVVHRESVRCLLEINEQVFLSASLDGVICVWNSETLTAVRTLNRHEVYRDSTKLYKYSVRSMAPYKEGCIVATVGYGFGIFNTLTGDTELEKMDAHEAEVMHIIPFGDKSRIVTCSVDSKIRIWSIKTVVTSSIISRDRLTHTKKAVLIADLSGHSGAVNALLACNESQFVSAGADGLLIMWKESREENHSRDTIATESLRRQMYRRQTGVNDFAEDFLLNDDLVDEEEDEDESENHSKIFSPNDNPNGLIPENLLATTPQSYHSSANTPPMSKIPSWTGRFGPASQDSPDHYYYVHGNRNSPYQIDEEKEHQRDSLDDIDFNAPPKPLAPTTPVPDYVWDRAEYLRKHQGMPIPDIAAYLHQQGYGVTIIDQITRKQRELSNKENTESKAPPKSLTKS